MSDDKRLPASSNNKNAVRLHDSGLSAGSLIDQSLSKLDSEQAKNLMAKAAEEALRLEVKAREQNMDYTFGRKAAEDHIEAFNMLEKSGKTMRQEVTSNIKTGAGQMRIESKSGATCFVASATYGDPNHPDVIFLRHFRDGYLVRSYFGLAFVQWYWINGPILAKAVEASSTLRKISRKIISGIVVLLKAVCKKKFLLH
jgi:hypothetical protein